MPTADEIPVAHTPPGGYGSTFPPLVLADGTEEHGVHDVSASCTSG